MLFLQPGAGGVITLTQAAVRDDEGDALPGQHGFPDGGEGRSQLGAASGGQTCGLIQRGHTGVPEVGDGQHIIIEGNGKHGNVRELGGLNQREGEFTGGVHAPL